VDRIDNTRARTRVLRREAALRLGTGTTPVGSAQAKTNRYV
jgi:hypothetical protein